MTTRVGVVGAGAIGLAIAKELADRGREVFVLEAGPRPGAGITSRSSEVVHAGLYYERDSLKSRLCIEGRDRLYTYLESRGEGVRRCGKLVVATDDDEVSELATLAANARECGVADVELLDADEVRRREPTVRCAAALWSPRTGIFDAHGLVRSLRADLERAGGVIVTNARVVGATKTGGGYRLESRRGDEIESTDFDVVVNAAGLSSDVVARLPFRDAPPPSLPTLRFVKGSYVRLQWPRSGTPPPACLVYPLPFRDRPGLGIHLTIDLAGGLRLGPDSEPLPENVEDYSLADDIVTKFGEAARRYLDIPEGSILSPDYAGIRPVRSDVRAFHIAEDLPGWVNLIGIDSPGLTASLAIGRYVADLLGEQSL